jgi:hypothetical protein
MTGADGMAAFSTIYPSWYERRAILIHLKARVLKDRVGNTAGGRPMAADMWRTRASCSSMTRSRMAS